MKILYSIDKTHNPIVVKINDIMIGKVKAIDHFKKQKIQNRQKYLRQSIKEKGMLNPILVSKDNEFLSGGCRLMYAFDNGYEAISAIVIDADITVINLWRFKQISSEYDLMIPEDIVGLSYETIQETLKILKKP